MTYQQIEQSLKMVSELLYCLWIFCFRTSNECSMFTPVTVPPQVGTKVAGPKSGAHFSSFSWGKTLSCKFQLIQSHQHEQWSEASPIRIASKTNLLLQPFVLPGSYLRHRFPKVSHFLRNNPSLLPIAESQFKELCPFEGHDEVLNCSEEKVQFLWIRQIYRMLGIWCFLLCLLYLYSRVDAAPYRNTGTESWNRS